MAEKLDTIMEHTNRLKEKNEIWPRAFSDGLKCKGNVGLEGCKKARLYKMFKSMLL